MINTSDPEERRGILIPVSALMRACPLLAVPFRGLEAFREEDEAYFFGRDLFKTRLWESFQAHTITLLTGPSGVGKSSLINAGFLPLLRAERNWEVVRFRPGSRPVERLARELVAVLKPGLDILETAEETKKQEENLLNDPSWLARIGETSQLCVIIDQFEETFTLALPNEPKQHRGFLETLEHVAGRSDLPSMRVVLGLRSDFQTLLQADEAAATLVDRVSGPATIMLRAMTPPERERVILEPLDAQHLDVALEDGLLGRVMEEVARNPDALPLLEFALSGLWQRVDISTEGRRLTVNAYNTIGGVTGALAMQADARIKELRLDVKLVRRLLIELVRVAETSEQDTRRPRSKEELDALDPALWEMAQKLAPTRLLVVSDEPAVDIVHEALFRQWTQLREWIDEEREFLRFRQRLEERHREWEADKGELLSGRMLDDAERWVREHPNTFTPQALAYLVASRQARVAQSIWDEVNRLWNRIELHADSDRGDLSRHDVDALLSLQRASSEVRQAFLLSALSDEARARRFCRQRQVVIRAAVIWDSKLLREVSAAVLDRVNELIPHGDSKRTVAVLTLAADTFLWGMLDGLGVSTVIERSVAAIGETTDEDQTVAYVQAIASLAGAADATFGQDMIKRLVAAIGETTDEYQTVAYAQAIASLARAADPAFGQDMIVHLVADIEKTTNVNQTAAYAQAIVSLSGSADPLSARSIIESLAEAIGETTNEDQMVAYAQAIVSLSGSADPVSARSIIERMAAVIGETTDPRHTTAYAQTIVSLAELVDAAFGQDMIKRLVATIRKTSDKDQKGAYTQAIASLAKPADAAFGQDIIKRLVAAIDESFLEGQTAAYAQAIASLAGSVDAAFGQDIIKRLVAAIGESFDEDQRAAYAQTIALLAGSVDAAFRQDMIKRLVAAIDESFDEGQMAAYVQAIASLAGAADATFGQEMIERLVVDIGKSFDGDQRTAYAQTIALLAGSVDAAFRQDMIKRLVAAIDESFYEGQTVAYAQTIASLAESVDVTFGQEMTERLVADIEKTSDRNLTIAYAQAIMALSGPTGVTTLTTVANSAGQWIAELEHVGDKSHIHDVGSALVKTRHVMRPEVWLFAATEFLKHPLSVDVDGIVTSLADYCGLAAGSWRNVWDIVLYLEEHVPWLQLRAPFGSEKSIRRQIALLTEHGTLLSA
ncbi:hypothetical protein NKW45_00655 [Acetobacter orientalis]|nr:hypothetical protein [Acetobacter orientalis]MCP1220358.1 hypothetical protein [Acetobacter orientalis]